MIEILAVLGVFFLDFTFYKIYIHRVDFVMIISISISCLFLMFIIYDFIDFIKHKFINSTMLYAFFFKKKIV